LKSRHFPTMPLHSVAALPSQGMKPPGTVSYDRYQTALHASECARVLGSLGGMRAAREWCRGQGWGALHTATVMKLASQVLVAGNSDTIDEARARLLVMLEGELAAAEQCVVAYAKDGKPIIGKDRGAIVQFTKLIMTLKGLDVRTHVHVDVTDRPLKELTTEQLLAEASRLEDEMAGRAVLAEGVAGDTRTPAENDGSHTGLPSLGREGIRQEPSENRKSEGAHPTPGDTRTPNETNGSHPETPTGIGYPTPETSGVDVPSILNSARESARAFRARAALYGSPSC
jgi:hypothetical protein